ncbi:MAG: radical SAM protein [Candidatus Riflebacteria bacterium]|nr:radical SAM protein [Candidatus Riflebacteria bacterium]
MRILFICPPNYRFREVSFQDFGLGPAYLAAVLGKNHEVAYYETDAPAEAEIKNISHDYTSYEYLIKSHHKYVEGLQNESHLVWKEIERVISDFAPDIVGLSTMTPSYPSALIVAKMAKRLSNATVIFGGVHASILPDEVLQNSFIDFVVRGEGETTIEELVQCLEKKTDPSMVKGISFRKNGQIIHTPRRDLIPDLDSIPFPVRSSLLFPERFSDRNFAHIFVGRGCPADCYFCANPTLWGRKYRLRSAKNVFEELKLLTNEYGKVVLFEDDNLLVSKAMLFELCSLIKQEIPDLVWRCQSRVDTLSEEKLLAIKEAGCWDVKLGFESGSDRILTYINKKLTEKKIMECCEMIVKSGMQFSVNFMFGFPDETLEDMRATLEMIKKIPANSIAISKFIPLPGTKLYNDVIKSGLIADSPPKYEHFDLYSNYYHFSKHLSREQLQEFWLEIYHLVEEKNKKTRKGPPKPKQVVIPTAL